MLTAAAPLRFMRRSVGSTEVNGLLRLFSQVFVGPIQTKLHMLITLRVRHHVSLRTADMGLKQGTSPTHPKHIHLWYIILFTV